MPVPTGPSSSRPRRAVRRLLLVLAVAGAAAGVQLVPGIVPGIVPVAGLGAPPASGATPPGPSGPAPPAAPDLPPAELNGQVGRGLELFQQSCAGCHGQAGGGSWRGPSLIGVGAASADWWVSSGRMPLQQPDEQPERGAPAFPPGDVDALVAYVASLGDGPPVPVVRPGDLGQGRELYLRNCASCHSAGGVGAALPDGLWAPSLLPVPPVQVAEAVRIGPGVMPQFPPGTLSDAEVDAVVTYVQALQRPQQDRGGLALARVGPVAEGAVGWLVGLGLLVVVVRVLGKRAP